MKQRTSLSKEPTLTTIVSSIQELSAVVKGLDRKVDGLDQKIDHFDQVFEKRFEEVKEVVEFLKENAVTRDELDAEFEEVQAQIRASGNETIQHIDGLVHLYMKQEVELAAVAHRITRHEETMHGKK